MSHTRMRKKTKVQAREVSVAQHSQNIRQSKRYVKEINHTYAQSLRKLLHKAIVAVRHAPKVVKEKVLKLVKKGKATVYTTAHRLKNIYKKFKYDLMNFVVFPHISRHEKKEIETGTTRMWDKKGYVAYVKPEEEEAFYKSYGKKKSTYSDDVNESLKHPDYYGNEDQEQLQSIEVE